ncbi:sensor histidine kinase [uncultured Ruminococcus sp.]|uniref:sensor histidine kinase n=1 Tax=uncultured Ruminococcus sp. TaxID=165186 RepID=UPI0025DBEC9F|nr:histidine kinase [uncultured Ruminococcus sp.]
MERFIDKLAIILICMPGLLSYDGTAAPVAAFLAAVTVSALVQINSAKKVSAVLLAAGAGLCAVMPCMICMLPLLLYDALWEKKWWVMLAGLSVFADPPPPMPIVTALAECAVTVMIYLRLSKLEKTVGTLKDLRDEVTEVNLRLKQRNEAITRAQDSEIHIATLKERNRIAREIHDNVGHMLTRSLLQAGALSVINKDEAMKEPLESLRMTLDTAMTSIRQSVHGLHDESIDLRRAVDESISSVDGRFTVRLDYDISEKTAGNVKLCLLGIIREGLSNAAKHSNGDRITVSVQEHPAFYRLTIEDNGNCSAIADTGIGLHNMRDRAETLGGSISFTPSEKGFRIFVSIPKK